VAENWRRWQMMYPTMAAVRSNQVHGARVRKITRADAASVEDADGMVTAVAGLALCVYTADCVPILMVDPERRLVGALHAGWRGTLRNIAAAGVAAMVRLGARRETLRVALGPAIGRCCFEVDHELVDDFARAFPASARHSRAGKPGKAYLDLRAINCAQLSAEGIARQNLMQVGPCTRCANAQFFSRRAVPGGTSGLQMSFIGFVDED
jgi:YfiH family protein